MKTNIEINNNVKATFDSIESISEVNVSPFFKENVMHKIRNASEEIQDSTWSWFTPKLQLATLVCVVVMNVMAFSNFKTSTYNDNISNFTESYGLSTSTESSILN